MLPKDSLRFGSWSIDDYAIDFRMLASESVWNTEALHSAFLNGLSKVLKDELASRDNPYILDEVIGLAIWIDNRLRERRRERTEEFRIGSSVSGSAEGAEALLAPLTYAAYACSVCRWGSQFVSGPRSYPSEESMQLGRTRLSALEIRRRINYQRCLFCGQSGHFYASCPELTEMG
jgi:hypothetical protein